MVVALHYGPKYTEVDFGVVDCSDAYWKSLRRRHTIRVFFHAADRPVALILHPVFRINQFILVVQFVVSEAASVSSDVLSVLTCDN